MIEWIKIVVDSALDLEHLFVTVDRALLSESYQEYWDYLKLLFERDNFKSLHLKFHDPEIDYSLLTFHANQLASFKQPTKIHFFSSFFATERFVTSTQTICSFEKYGASLSRQNIGCKRLDAMVVCR